MNPLDFVSAFGRAFRLTHNGMLEASSEVMNLSKQCNERVTIERQDGTRFENVPALITPGKALVPDASIPIEPGDAILSQLPSRIIERLIVRDPGFFAGVHGVQAHYQVKYHREGQGPEGSPGYYFHMHGDNSRVNINSTDSSRNTITHGYEDLSGLLEQLSRLRQSLVSKASGPEHYVAVGAVAEAEIAAKSGDRSKAIGALKALGGAGSWVLGVAKEVGVDLAAKVIAEAIK